MAAPVLRPFQLELKKAVYAAWQNGARNVLMRLDTGGGKTVTLSDIIREHVGASCVIAHRQELVGQLSLALARYGIRHDIVAAATTKRAIARLHVEELGYSFVTPGAPCVVAGVDTIIRDDSLARWAATVTLWVVDEGHHVVTGNKWHTVIELFSHPACRGLLPTATPKRADRKGLGRDNDGVADVMVQGPPMRWLIDNGYLSDYRIICPPSDMQVLSEVSASGDWSTQALRRAAEQSHIVGDVVSHYLKWASGKLGVTFSTDIETAGEIAAAFRFVGVRAEVLTGKTDDFLRRQILRRFAAREIDQIVAVDIISEGFDLPAIEAISMARPTASLALYMQQFGRALRPMPGKAAAIVIDHASNVVRHGGPPDRSREWSLDRRGKRASGASDGIPIRVCPADGCYTPYPAIKRVCPVCGHYVPPAERGSPAAVAGDLCELSPEVLAGLRADVASVDLGIPERRAELAATGLPQIPLMANVKRHAERQEAQAELREAMGFWGGVRTAEGLADDEIQRLFFYRFGIDVLSAQALGAVEARTLMARLFEK